jgi:hypothetical protein
MQKRCDANIQQDMLDREASLHELAQGISWGMSEDAPGEFGGG